MSDELKRQGYRWFRRVRMLREADGSPDGFHVVKYPKGEVCWVPMALGDLWLACGWAERVRRTPQEVKGYG